jgi:hypothetical protein
MESIGEETCFDHEGSTFKCHMCRDIKTVDMKVATTMPTHGDIWRLVCNDCIQTSFQKERVSKVQFTMHSLNEELIQITKYMIPFIKEEIRFHEEHCGDYEMQVRKNLKMREIMTKRIKNMYVEHTDMRSTLQEHGCIIIPLHIFGSCSEYYNCMIKILDSQIQSHASSIDNVLKRSSHDAIDNMKNVLVEQYKRVDELKGGIRCFLNLYITPPIIKPRLKPVVEDEGVKELSSMSSEVVINKAKEIVYDIRTKQSTYASSRYIPPWVSDFVDDRRYA